MYPTFSLSVQRVKDQEGKYFKDFVIFPFLILPGDCMIRKQYLTKYKGRRHYICFKYLPKYKLSDLISKPARHFSTPLHAHSNNT